MGFNAKLFEIMVYPESYDCSQFEAILQMPGIKNWAWILHDKDKDKDGNLKKAHIHITIRTTDSRNSTYVAKWFNVNENAIERVKGRWADMLLYLTHKNSPQKYQYSDDEVQSNFDWKKEIEKTKDTRLAEIIEGIGNGSIREYNYTKHISDTDYIRFKKQIETAFKYRMDRMRGEKREMECIFITGDSGRGKTTYAKMICEEKNLSYFVSSGSNDVLDGYMGEDVIILDDLRPSAMMLSDLLKMLDNHTSSTVKSRYRNKVLECKMIIITSVLEIKTFFNNVFTEEKETMVQLMRRCKTYIKMYEDTMNIYVYDDYLRNYDIPITAKNPITTMYKPKRLSKEEQLKKINGILGNIQTIEEDKGNESMQEIKEIFGEIPHW